MMEAHNLTVKISPIKSQQNTILEVTIKKHSLVPEALFAHKTFSTKEIIRSDADSNNYISTDNKTKVKAVIKPLAPLMKVGEYQHSQYL